MPKPKNPLKPPSIKTKSTSVYENTYTCLICQQDKPESQYYLARSSPLWLASQQHVLFCKECLNKLYEDYRSKYGDETALLILCHIMDYPFLKELYSDMIASGSFLLGSYIKNLNLGRYKGKNFASTIIDGSMFAKVEEIKSDAQASREVRWNKKDKQNKEFVISTVGYDPFDDVDLTDEDRRSLFNAMSGYCDIEGIRSDKYKMDSVVRMMFETLQLEKINRKINESLKEKDPNEKVIDKWMATKTRIMSNLSSIAKDNNISAMYSNAGKAGVSTLSAKMKEMEESGYEDIKVNVFSIETCAAMKQIADLSNQSLLEQLHLDAGEYSELVKSQRSMIITLQDKMDELTEELRVTKNHLAICETDLSSYNSSSRTK